MECVEDAVKNDRSVVYDRLYPNDDKRKILRPCCNLKSTRGRKSRGKCVNALNKRYRQNLKRYGPTVPYLLPFKCSRHVRNQVALWPLLVEMDDPKSLTSELKDNSVVAFLGNLRCYFARSVLGVGRFGKVYACIVKDQQNNPPREMDEIFAMKILDITAMRSERRVYDTIAAMQQSEALQKQVTCPFFIRKKWTLNSNNGEKGVLVTEMALGGNMADLLWTAGRGLGDLALTVLGAQLIDAVGWLHEKCRILHLDVKPDNLLLDSKGLLKLCDFGHATFVPAHVNCVPSSLAPGPRTMHLPPEVMSRFDGCGMKVVNWAVDWFSVGVSLFWMAHLRFPYDYSKDVSVNSANDVAIGMKKGVAQVIFSNEGLSESMSMVIKHLVEPRPEKRISSANAALSYPCFLSNPIFFSAKTPNSQKPLNFNTVENLRQAIRRTDDIYGNYRVPLPLIPVAREVEEPCDCITSREEVILNDSGIVDDQEYKKMDENCNQVPELNDSGICDESCDANENVDNVR